jgi:NADPH:quinone reductase-like Zn-dependent oxidoreductase
VLIRVRAAAMNPIDAKIRNGQFRLVFRLSPPFVPGFDFAGEVVEAGGGAGGLKPGQRVFGSVRKPGTHAEYVCTPADLTVSVPRNVSLEEAGAAPGSALTALMVVEDQLRLSAGQEILINGASGGVGSYAVQIARESGARVTAVASAPNHDLLRELGASECIDYRNEDFTTRTNSFDCIFDVVPNRSFSECRDALKPGGTYVTTLPGPGPLFWRAATRLLPLSGSRRADFVILRPARKSLLRLAELLGSGRLRSVISKTLVLERIHEAHERMQSQHTMGKIVVLMD